jgi:putative copper export protein
MQPDVQASAAAIGPGNAVRRATAVVELLAVAVWLGGLLALGAVAAPIVFSMVAFPSNADAMTVVFRRFDRVAIGCAALVLAAEASRGLARVNFTVSDRMRAAAGAMAAGLAVLEATSVSPRIAALHAGGALRGIGSAGMELARLHDVAEWCGKAEVVLLGAVIVLEVVALSAPRRGSS